MQKVQRTGELPGVSGEARDDKTRDLFGDLQTALFGHLPKNAQERFAVGGFDAADDPRFEPGPEFRPEKGHFGQRAVGAENHLYPLAAEQIDKGNYDYYVLHKDEMYNLQHPQTSAAVSTSNAPVQQAAPQSSSKEDFLRFKSEQAALKKKENELKKTEERIAVLEEQIEALNEKMNDPEIATNVGKLTEISKEHEKLSEELETLYEKWEELSE